MSAEVPGALQEPATRWTVKKQAHNLGFRRNA